jgi:hypothetical protein
MAASGALPAEMSELGFENPVTTMLDTLLADA